MAQLRGARSAIAARCARREDGKYARAMSSPQPGHPPSQPGHPPYNEGRDSLIAATVRVIARYGLRGLTYRRVAAEAGVTHGLVGYHFGSVQNLAHATLKEVAREAVEGSSLEPESGRFEDFARDLARLVETAPDAQAFQFEMTLEARRNHDLQPDIRALYEDYFEVVERALQNMGLQNEKMLARLIFAALDGITIQQLIFADPGQTDQLIELLHDLLRRYAD